MLLKHRKPPNAGDNRRAINLIDKRLAGCESGSSHLARRRCRSAEQAGFSAYPDAVAYSLGTRVDFAQLVKVYKPSTEGKGSERRYSPADVVSAIPTPSWGNPIPERISHHMLSARI